MISDDDVGRVIDMLRPSLNRMVSIGIDEARRKGQIPSLTPGTVTSADMANGSALVLFDTGGDPIPVKTLIGMPAVNERVMVLWEPPSMPFIVGYLRNTTGGRRIGGRWLLSTPQLIASAGAAKDVVWDTEIENSDSFLLVPNATFTAPSVLAPGRYLVAARLSFAAGVGGSRAFVQLVGITDPTVLYRTPIVGAWGGGNEDIGSVCGWFNLSPGDQFRVQAWQTTGVSVNVTGVVEFWRVDQ